MTRANAEMIEQALGLVEDTLMEIFDKLRQACPANVDGPVWEAVTLGVLTGVLRVFAEDYPDLARLKVDEAAAKVAYRYRQLRAQPPKPRARGRGRGRGRKTSKRGRA